MYSAVPSSLTSMCWGALAMMMAVGRLQLSLTAGNGQSRLKFPVNFYGSKDGGIWPSRQPL